MRKALRANCSIHGLAPTATQRSHRDARAPARPCRTRHRRPARPAGCGRRRSRDSGRSRLVHAAVEARLSPRPLHASQIRAVDASLRGRAGSELPSQSPKTVANTGRERESAAAQREAMRPIRDTRHCPGLLRHERYRAGGHAVSSVKARSRGVPPQQRDHCVPERREYPGDGRQTAVLTQDVADARGVRRPSGDRVGVSLLSAHDERRVVSMCAPVSSAHEVVDPRPRTTLGRPEARASSNAPTRSTSVVRMKIERDRWFQRLSRVSTAASRAHEYTSRRARRPLARSVRRARPDPWRALRPARGDPLERRSRRPERNELGTEQAECSVAGPRDPFSAERSLVTCGP